MNPRRESATRRPDAAPRVLITAGPTHEPVDQVRYIGNRSSGRMGLALAEACTARGWPTTLLLGPVGLSPAHSSLLNLARFQSAADLRSLLQTRWPEHDVVFMAAAVADFTPVADGMAAKLARSDGPLTLRLEPTTDLLAELVESARPDQVVIGFALEPSEQLLASARQKLHRKAAHVIVANPLETMDALTVSATVLFRDGGELAAPPNISKREFADWLLAALEPLLVRATA